MTTTDTSKLQSPILPAAVQFSWNGRKSCSFSPTEDCIEAVLVELVRRENCSYLRAYSDIDAPSEVLEVIDCYMVELFSDADKYEPYYWGPLYIHRTPDNAAIDSSAKAVKTLAGISTMFDGDVYVVSPTGITFQ